MDRDKWKLGDTASLFESQGGAGAVSPGSGDSGGVSYGIYQFSSKAGTAREFVAQSQYSERFKGLTPGTEEFSSRWREVAAEHPDFGSEQHQFIKETHVDPIISALSKRGIDVGERGPAIQDMVWSMSVQYRNRTPALIERGLRESYGEHFDVGDITDEAMVRAVQSSKLLHVNQDFSSSAEAVRLGVETRILAEEAALVRLASTGSIGTSADTVNDWQEASPIRKGASRDRILDVQEKLRSLGINGDGSPAIEPDGNFGPATKEAVKAFQRSVGLPPTGVVGGLTMHYLDEQFSVQQNTDVPAERMASQVCRLDDSTHPDHDFFKTTQSRVWALDQSLGRSPDQHSDNIASALTVQARYDGLQRIDQIALSPDGSKLWAVEMSAGRTDHLFDKRTCVSTASANMTMEESAASWPTAFQQFQQKAAEQNQDQQQAHAATQTDAPPGPAPGGPTLSH